MSGMIEVGILSDRRLFQGGVSSCLAAADDVVVVASGPDVLDDPRLGADSVVIVDGRLCGPGGVDAGRVGRPVVLLADASDDLRVLDLVRSGVRGLIVDDCSPDVLVSAVHAATQGSVYLGGGAVDHLVVGHLAAGGPLTTLTVDDLGLTAREIEIWAWLACGRSNGEIAGRMDLSARTVRFHLSNLFRKIRVDNRGEAIALAYRTAGLPNSDVAGRPGLNESVRQ